MQNFKTLRQPLLGELAMSRKKEEEERKKEKIMPSTMAPTFMPAAKGSALTPLGPKFGG
jgi:hypothetical protein